MRTCYTLKSYDQTTRLLHTKWPILQACKAIRNLIKMADITDVLVIILFQKSMSKEMSAFFLKLKTLT